MQTQTTGAIDAKDAEQATGPLVTVASTLNDRLAITAGELARSQDLLREASAELMTAFRGAADRIVAAQRVSSPAAVEAGAEYGISSTTSIARCSTCSPTTS